MKRITFSIPDKDYEEIRTRAFEKRVSVSRYITNVLIKTPAETVAGSRPIAQKKTDKVRGEIRAEDYV